MVVVVEVVDVGTGAGPSVCGCGSVGSSVGVRVFIGGVGSAVGLTVGIAEGAADGLAVGSKVGVLEGGVGGRPRSSSRRRGRRGRAAPVHKLCVLWRVYCAALRASQVFARAI